MNIYVVNDEEIVSLLPSGRFRWNIKVGEVSHTPFIDEDGMIYLATRDFHAIAINPGGTIYWKKKINDLESSQPFVDNRGYLHLKLFEGSHIIINRKRGFFNPSVVKVIPGKSLATGCKSRGFPYRKSEKYPIDTPKWMVMGMPRFSAVSYTG